LSTDNKIDAVYQVKHAVAKSKDSGVKRLIIKHITEISLGWYLLEYLWILALAWEQAGERCPVL